LLDSFILLTGHFGATFDVNMNAVVNAPNMDLALGQMMSFKVLEDRLNQMMQTN
jgi:hypothetical protein